jgi:hypothetical protein
MWPQFRVVPRSRSLFNHLNELLKQHTYSGSAKASTFDPVAMATY